DRLFVATGRSRTGTGDDFSMEFNPPTSTTLAASDVVLVRMADVDSSSTEEVIVDFSDGSQQVFFNVGGELFPKTATRRVAFGDFDGDGEEDSAHIWQSSSGALFVDYNISGYGKALNNAMNSQLDAGSDVKIHVGRFGSASIQDGILRDQLVVEFNNNL